MAWVRVDDQVPRNHKMLKAGPAACWLWLCGLAHAQSQFTDGFISHEALPMIGVQGKARCERLAQTLVSAGLFEVADGGYRIHHYHVHNRDAQTAKERRDDLAAARQQAGAKGGRASGEVRRQKIEANEANPKQTDERLLQ